jgi:DnaJ-domain-containing protein 1
MNVTQTQTSDFVLFQIGMAAVFIFVAWRFFGPKEPESNFRVLEADRKKQNPPRSAAPKPQSSLADATLKEPKTRPPKKKGPFLLEGFVGDGKSHEILGISPQSDEKTIRNAHRELMKIYHPDLVGRPGSREWNDAQKIAETINRARDEMLAIRKQTQ